VACDAKKAVSDRISELVITTVFILRKAAQQSLQPTLKAAQFSAHEGRAGLGAAEAAVALLPS
jgi:hypothetical protein